MTATVLVDPTTSGESTSAGSHLQAAAKVSGHLPARCACAWRVMWFDGWVEVLLHRFLFRAIGCDSIFWLLGWCVGFWFVRLFAARLVGGFLCGLLGWSLAAFEFVIATVWWVCCFLDLPRIVVLFGWLLLVGRLACCYNQLACHFCSPKIGCGYPGTPGDHW